MEGQSASRPLDTDVRNFSFVLNSRGFNPWNLAPWAIYDHNFLAYASAVEPPERDHPKALTRIESISVPLSRRLSYTSTFWKIIYCVLYLSYDMCSSSLSGKGFHILCPA